MVNEHLDMSLGLACVLGIQTYLLSCINKVSPLRVAGWAVAGLCGRAVVLSLGALEVTVCVVIADSAGVLLVHIVSPIKPDVTGLGLIGGTDSEYETVGTSRFPTYWGRVHHIRCQISL